MVTDVTMTQPLPRLARRPDNGVALARPDHVVEALRSVTADEVQRAARTYLDPHDVTVTVVGDSYVLTAYKNTQANEGYQEWRFRYGPSATANKDRPGAAVPDR